ncbi:lipopolysaccharide assembly protein LapA domain-containing protein [Nocardia sp. 348MFTsu5.1]|uniref:lipopolysaccharide assembly protein LapA domain-containing protein n=1 Tax=Nocardia sp. 348MFTsu5.1 TaxID=1172185 RepID=UPI00037256F5|nr:LapA family protein [Nocardia sp. 348MFTsu5.1]
MSKSAGTSSSNIFAKRSPATWVAVILAVVAVVFIFQNRDSADINLLWVEVSSPLWFILLVVFVVGWIVGILTMRGRTKRKESVAK